jgi:hypothetical protein
VFDAELGRSWALATEVLHSVELEAQLCFVQACRDLITGDVVGARQVGERGFGLLTGVSATWREPSRFVMESCILLSTHTLSDQAEVLERQATHSDHPSIPHLAAPAAALAYAERGDLERARVLTRQWFTSPPRSWSRLQAVAYWAQVATLTGEPDPQWCYDQLLSHAGELALVGIGADCGGAVDSILAGLVLRLGRPEEALERARAGMVLERHAGARPWYRRTTSLIEEARSRTM